VMILADGTPEARAPSRFNLMNLPGYDTCSTDTLLGGSGYVLDQGKFWRMLFVRLNCLIQLF
jgi:hypothetical protein